MPDSFTVDSALAWLTLFRDRVGEQRAALTDLDRAIGDADHGSNMARGTAAMVEAVTAESPDTLDALFKKAGMTLVSTVGGASGPLYGTFFLRFASAAGAVQELDAAGLGRSLRAGLDGVVARGKAEVGDKTMLDALTPALASYDSAAGDGIAAATRAAAESSAEGRDATEPLVARKGRASYLGERSAGHIDPGSASSTLLLEALADVMDP